jgi:hypothetical protein
VATAPCPRMPAAPVIAMVLPSRRKALVAIS